MYPPDMDEPVTRQRHTVYNTRLFESPTPMYESPAIIMHIADVYLDPIFWLIFPNMIKNMNPTSPATVPMLSTVEYSNPDFAANAGATMLLPSLTIPT